MNRQEANETLYANLEKMDLREMGIEADEIAEAVEVLKAPDWISVKDRRPEAGASVLVTDGEVVDFLYALSDTTLETRYSITITHWMPIPPLPEVEG